MASNQAAHSVGRSAGGGPAAPEVLHRVRRDRVRGVFTGRTGGVSEGPCAGGNLASHVGDDPRAVAENRRLLSRHLEIGAEWAEMEQVHGAEVLVASPGSCGSADALVCSADSLPVAVFTADCLPILLAGSSGESFAVVHAGWRGLDGGVVEAAWSRLAAEGDPPAAVFLGPCIGACCYRVGEELAQRFASRFGADCVTDGPNLDLKAVAGKIVRDLWSDGAGEVLDLGPCTHSPELFSYRLDGPETGRQALLAWIEPS